MGAHYLASSISYPINIHNDDTGANDNDDSRSFETPIITVLTLLVIQWSQQPHQIYQNFPHLEKYIFKTEVKLSEHHNLINQEYLPQLL